MTEDEVRRIARQEAVKVLVRAALGLLCIGTAGYGVWVMHWQLQQPAETTVAGVLGQACVLLWALVLLGLGLLATSSFWFGWPRPAPK